MRRLFWLALGATLAVLIMRRTSRALERLSPQSVAGSAAAALSELAAALGSFTAEVREAMTVRELQLRQATGLDAAS